MANSRASFANKVDLAAYKKWLGDATDNHPMAAKFIDDLSKLDRQVTTATQVINNGGTSGAGGTGGGSGSGDIGGTMFVYTTAYLPVGRLASYNGITLQLADCRYTNRQSTHVIVSAAAGGVFLGLPLATNLYVAPTTTDDGTGQAYLYQDGQITLNLANVATSGLPVGDAKVLQPVGTVAGLADNLVPGTKVVNINIQMPNILVGGDE